uniref:7TM_GPCR_Srx domain-containing protein n=1 Tax=Steinernema glaseri TaxID=37863 RepID=A0A1I8A4K1_9BILA
MVSLNFVAGCIYGILSILLFALNALVLVTIFQFNEFSTITYRIIKNMCLACLIQQVAFFIGALMSFSHSNFNDTFEEIFGALVQSGWILYISLSLTLAVNRMLTFSYGHLSSPVSHFFLALSWLHSIAHFVILMLPDFGFEYCYEYEEEYVCLGWYFDSSDGSYVLEPIESYLLLALQCMILICYIAVLGCLMRTMSNAKRNISSFRTEMRILLVSVVSFIYEGGLIVFLHFGIEILPSENSTEMVLNVFWMLDSGLFSLATLLINTKIRGRLLSMFSRREIVTAVQSYQS